VIEMLGLPIKLAKSRGCLAGPKCSISRQPETFTKRPQNLE
jgi:hypothetical protein